MALLCSSSIDAESSIYATNNSAPDRGPLRCQTPSSAISGAVPTAPNFATSMLAAGAAVMAEVAKCKDVVVIMHSCGAGIGCEA